jgi:tetratricopeptide (TPR) repeat protein
MQAAQNHSFEQAFIAISKQQFAEAFQLISKKSCPAHLQFGQWLMQNQRPLLAGTWYQHLISTNFAEPQLSYLCGVCFSVAGEKRLAERFLNNAIQSKHTAELPYIALAQMYQSQHNFEQANSILQKMLQSYPNNSQLWTQSGALFVESQQYAIAQSYFQKVIEQWPDQAMAYNDLANCYQHLGNFEESQHMYRQALSKDPKIAGAYLGLANSRKYAESHNSIIEFLDKAQQSIKEPEVSACYHFAKAKIFDDMKFYDKAWQQAVLANDICKQHQPAFSISKWNLNLDRIIQTYPALKQTTTAEISTPIPVFIIGMPRSGTTLLEKLLSGFDAMSIAGELDGFDHILGSLAGGAEPGIYYPQQLAEISNPQKQQLRDYYLQLLSSKADSSSRWIVDKNPLNFIHLGLIQWLFPEAIFIHNKRHPMDILLSNYFQFFAHPNLSYSFSIETIISFINGYQRLMNHWQKLSTAAGLRLFEVEYSNVVQHTEATLEALTEFFGSKHLPIKSTQEIITTASVWQARQPIYSSSIERWKNYQSQLSPYTSKLESWL